MKLSKAQNEALELLATMPRFTSKRTSLGDVSGVVMKSLKARGLVERHYHGGEASRDAWKITEEGRTALAWARRERA